MSNRDMLGLKGLRVLEWTDPKTALCGKLLADMGAEVVLVEPPTGVALRMAPPCAQGSQESLLFWHTAANKRSLNLDLATDEGREVLLDLIKNVDIILDPFTPAERASLDLTENMLFATNPGLILASISGFGQSGPFCNYASSDIVGAAMSGLMSLTGKPDEEPLTPPALQPSQIASIWATLAIQGAVYRKLKTGQKARIDISLQEATFDVTEMAHSQYLANGIDVKRMGGDQPLTTPFRIYKTKDGFAFICAGGRQGWAGLVDWMSEYVNVPDDMRDPSMESVVERLKVRDKVNQIVGQFGMEVDNVELFVRGAGSGMPNAPLNTIPDMLEDEQLIFRKFFGTLSDPRDGYLSEDYPYALLPFRSVGEPFLRQSARPPSLGGHTDEVIKEWASPGRVWPDPVEPERKYPLQGVNVLDLCAAVAGPTMGKVLGDLGATLIKIETVTGDGSRSLVPFPKGREMDNAWSYSFHDLNRNKRSVTLNLKHPKAQQVALSLTEWTDIVLENFTTGTLSRLGIPYEVLSQVNPRVILGSITGYGQNGPRKSWPSMHPTVSALSGISGLFAYKGGDPQGFGNSYMDHISGYMGAIGVMDALLRREVNDAGDHVDIAMLESAVTTLGTQVLDWAVNGRVPQPEGNWAGALGALFQGCYQCGGHDKWIAVTAPDGDALSAIGQIVGQSVNATANDVERALIGWLRGLDPWVAFRKLQEAGIPAGVVSHGSDLADKDEQLRHRRIFARMPHPDGGEVPVAQCPIWIDGERLSVRSCVDSLGGYTEQALKGLVGLSDRDYEGLVADSAV
ncbi:CoA transferase [Dehalococcoidia bacterium]|nr:CoA transferase [Dehalococcoidia bacterium]